MVDPTAYDCDFENKWCPGCGNFPILAALKNALAASGLAPHQVLLISGIGQAAKTPHFLNCNFFHTLHGRALAAATGAKIANHELTILVNSGDGDCYGEGGNHFINAVRRNIDITLLVHDNKVYGLTKGQASPTSDPGMVTKIQRHGVTLAPFNPLAVSLCLGAGFVARGFSGNKDHLADLIQAGISHKGFSLIDILQPCVSFNAVNTYKWYKDRVYDLAEENHDPSDFENALTVSRIWGDKIPIGLVYRKEKPAFTDYPEILAERPLISNAYDPEKLQTVLDGV